MEEARETLIHRFEAMIDLPAYLGQRGFTPAAAQPSVRGLLMVERGARGALLLKRDANQGGWTYAPIDHPANRHTVTDYLQRHDRLSRAACLERLIALVSGRRTRCPDVLRYRAYVLSKPEVLRRAQQAYVRACERFLDATNLLDRLGIRRDMLDEWRFGALATRDDVARALTEPEGLWISRYRVADDRLVFTERPIDAISIEQDSRDRRSCYVAVGARLGDASRSRVALLLARLPQRMSVVLAFGRDGVGRRLVDDIQSLAPALWMQRASPTFGTRWNDHVQLEARHAESLSQAMRRPTHGDTDGLALISRGTPTPGYVRGCRPQAG